MKQGLNKQIDDEIGECLHGENTIAVTVTKEMSGAALTATEAALLHLARKEVDHERRIASLEGIIVTLQRDNKTLLSEHRKYDCE